MPFVDAKQGRVLINDRHLSASIRGWDIGASRKLDDVTTILDDGRRWNPGLISGSLKLDALYDGSGAGSGGLYDEITAAAGVDDALVWSVAPAGLAVGAPALLANSELSDCAISSKVGDVVGMSVGGQPDDGVDFGFWHHALQAETASGNAPGVDAGGATVNGGVAVLHLTAYAGLTNIVVKVQHSTDNATWSDLVTFTPATGLTAERRRIAGTVNRYTRCLWTATGVGSATFAVAFARR